MIKGGTKFVIFNELKHTFYEIYKDDSSNNFYKLYIYS